MKRVWQTGPVLALLGILVALAAGVFVNARAAAYVLAAVMIAVAIARAVLPAGRPAGLAIRSATVDVLVLLISAIALITLAQTVPDIV